MVDLKGIEPSNLTDANRALSQLSYKPEFQLPEYYNTKNANVKKKLCCAGRKNSVIYQLWLLTRLH